MESMLPVLIVSAGWIFALCLHEFGHAVVAYLGGDKSVKDKGYLTLNPLRYTDPGLTLVVPLIFIMLGGIALPGAAVYINRSALRNRFWHSAVSAAGPFFSLMVAIAFAWPFILGYGRADVNEGNEAIWASLALLVYFQIVGVMLNSLPIPPLDGFGVIEPWLPEGMRLAARRFGRIGMFALFALLWFVQPLNALLWDSALSISKALGVRTYLIREGLELFQAQSVYLVIGIIIIMAIARRKRA